MATSMHRGLEAIIYEAQSQGDPPSVASETYDANGDRIHVVGNVDITGIAQTLLEDERSVDRIFERAGTMVKGLRNTSVTIPVYVTGKGEVTTGDATPTETALARLFEHGMGGISINDATTAKTAGSHSTDQVELTDSSSYSVGQFVAGVYASDTQARVWMRRVKTKVSDVITFERPLAEAPADGDKIVGCITCFFDQDVLEDSGGAADRTHSIFMRKAGSSTAVLELLGCKGAPSITGLNRGEIPQLQMEYQVATFRTSADDGTGDVSTISSTPSFNGTLHGSAPVSMGPRTKVYFDDYGSETATARDASNLEVGMGVTVSPIETVTSSADNMEGLGGWTIGKPDPSVTFQITPHTQDFHVDLEGETYKNFMLERRAKEGNAFAISAMQCEVKATPKLSTNGDVLATDVELRCHEIPDAVGTTDIAKTPLAIGFA